MPPFILHHPSQLSKQTQIMLYSFIPTSRQMVRLVRRLTHGSFPQDTGICVPCVIECGDWWVFKLRNMSKWMYVSHVVSNVSDVTERNPKHFLCLTQPQCDLTWLWNQSHAIHKLYCILFHPFTSFLSDCSNSYSHTSLCSDGCFKLSSAIETLTFSSESCFQFL